MKIEVKHLIPHPRAFQPRAEVVTAKDGYFRPGRFPTGDVVTVVDPSAYHVVVVHHFTEEELFDMLLDRREERRVAKAKAGAA